MLACQPLRKFKKASDCSSEVNKIYHQHTAGTNEAWSPSDQIRHQLPFQGSHFQRSYVKPKNNSIANHLLFRHDSAFYDDLSILTHY